MGICNSIHCNCNSCSSDNNTIKKQHHLSHSHSHSHTSTSPSDEPNLHEPDATPETAEAMYTKRNKQSNADSIINSKPLIPLTSDIIISRNTVLPDHLYTKHHKLGAGGYGEVWLVKHKYLHRDYAMKIITKKSNKQSEEKEIMNEIKILKSLDHPKILKVLDFYSTSNKYSIITEYCPFGDLFAELQRVKHFDEGSASFIMHQIFKAISYCHSMNVIHRDLKLENIMIYKQEVNKCLQVKIIDFGTAKIYEKGQNETRYVGTSYYIAPEVIQRKYNQKCDVWSCGVIMYILLTGRAPFEGDDDNEIIRAVKKGVYDTTTQPFPRLSSEAKDLIAKLLTVDNKKRISAADALKHRWFQSAKFKDKDKVNAISSTTAEKLMRNLKNYHSDNILQCAVIAYLVRFNTHLEQCNEAAKLFVKMDMNEDGKIERDELVEGIVMYLKLPRKQVEKEVDVVFRNIDTNHNGYIEAEEFIRAAIDKESLLKKDYLKFAFDFFDKDNSGKLVVNEVLKRFMESSKHEKEMKVIEKEIRKQLDQIDLNKDGVISFNEFCTMMHNIIQN